MEASSRDERVSLKKDDALRGAALNIAASSVINAPELDPVAELAAVKAELKKWVQHGRG